MQKNSNLSLSINNDLNIDDCDLIDVSYTGNGKCLASKECDNYFFNDYLYDENDADLYYDVHNYKHEILAMPFKYDDYSIYY